MEDDRARTNKEACKYRLGWIDMQIEVDSQKIRGIIHIFRKGK